MVSNDACFHCHISLNMQAIGGQQVKINKEMYNPYRIAVEDHLQSFDAKRPSVIIEEKTKVAIGKEYFKKNGHRNYVMMSQINYFYCISDEF